MARTALVAGAALAIVGGSAAGASAAQTTSARPAHAGPDFSRACAVVRTPGVMSCMALIRNNVKHFSAASLRDKAPTGDGYGPSTFQAAYNLPSSTAGKGQAVAAVDAYNNPDAVSDLATYRSAWGEAKCNTSTEAGCLTVLNQNGAASPLPKNAGSTGWDVEESLDVDMISAICPNCHIYLVEAKTPSNANLGTAVNSAAKVADFVSNSYGGSEASTEKNLDTKYYKHAGEAIVASAGDDGYGVSYPAASQYVTSVGGTTLTKASGTTRGYTETVWGSASGGEGTGSGCSAYEAKPTWQTDTGCSRRTDNDVSADANPNTGAAIYDSYSEGGWLEVGGTSESSPIIASVFALAGTPAAGTYPSSYPYAHTSDLYDVTSGANGSCSPAYLCHAETGYDGPTGLGTPNGVGAFTG
ncbi:MAG TPA: S53 family peptidase [Streptosporangiaceae bacterium]